MCAVIHCTGQRPAHIYNVKRSRNIQVYKFLHTLFRIIDINVKAVTVAVCSVTGQCKFLCCNVREKGVGHDATGDIVNLIVYNNKAL